MHCPRCGQQQLNETVRFCSRCGFPLDGVIQLLAMGGVLPVYQSEGTKEISPRRKGVRQGASLLLIGAVLVPILGVLAAFSRGIFEAPLAILVSLAAILCFLGGPLRMLYAALFEEGAPRRRYVTPPPAYMPPGIMAQPGASARGTMLPPPAANPAAAWRSGPHTAELVQPPSVTDNTTQLLESPKPIVSAPKNVTR